VEVRYHFLQIHSQCSLSLLRILYAVSQNGMHDFKTVNFTFYLLWFKYGSKSLTTQVAGLCLGQGSSWKFTKSVITCLLNMR